MQPAIRGVDGRPLITTRLASASSAAMTWERCPERKTARALAARQDSVTPVGEHGFIEHGDQYPAPGLRSPGQLSLYDLISGRALGHGAPGCINPGLRAC
jgi:hypothetical protein